MPHVSSCLSTFKSPIILRLLRPGDHLRHRRLLPLRPASQPAFLGRQVRSLLEAQRLRGRLAQVSESVGHGQRLRLLDDQELWRFRATVDARRFLGRYLSSRQVSCVEQAGPAMAAG